MKVVRVTNPQEKRDFIHITDTIYKDCPQYVPEWEPDTRQLIEGSIHTDSDFIQRQAFVAYCNGKPAGRILGIINHHANQRWKRHAARFALLEFIDDKRVSAALFKALTQWAQGQGMDCLLGPLGVTDFDKEGMLVEDFQLTGTINTIYNPPYYPEHMAALGFVKEVDWVQVRINIPKELPARYSRVAGYVSDSMNLKVRKLTRKDIRNGYGYKVFDLFNKAYAPLFGFTAFSHEQVDEFVNKYLFLIDMQLITAVENEEGELVGAAVTMRTLTQAMQRAKGRLWPFGWWHLAAGLLWRHEHGAEMLLIGVDPRYQGMGVNALFFDDLFKAYNRCGIQWAETGPQLEDNIKELSQWKALAPQFVKRRRCFRKVI